MSKDQMCIGRKGGTSNGKTSQKVLGSKNVKSKALGQADVGLNTRAVGPLVSHRIPPSLSVSICRMDIKRAALSRLMVRITGDNVEERIWNSAWHVVGFE